MNTIDTIDTPKWMQPSSSTSTQNSGTGFTRPKWMSGLSDGDNEQSGSASRNGLERLFGGRGGDGQVRI